MATPSSSLKSVVKSSTKQTQKNRQKDWQTTTYGKRENAGSEQFGTAKAYKDLSGMSPEALAMEKWLGSNTQYTPTERENDRLNKLNAAENKAMNHTPYGYALQDTLDSLQNQYLNRKAFNYNFNEDALYDMYRQQYEKQAQQAAANAAAQAAALSGGYGNSYGTSAAAQASQEYMTQLNNMLPQLQQMALDRYNSEGNELLTKLNLLNTDDEKQYGRWSDEDARLRADLDYFNSDYYNAANLGRSDHQNAYTNALNYLNTEADLRGVDVNETSNRENSWRQTSGQDEVKGGSTATNTTTSKIKETQNQNSTSTSSGSGGGRKKGGSGKSGGSKLSDAMYQKYIDKAARRITSTSDSGAWAYIENLLKSKKISQYDMDDMIEDLGIRIPDEYDVKASAGITTATPDSRKNNKKK